MLDLAPAGYDVLYVMRKDLKGLSKAEALHLEEILEDLTSAIRETYDGMIADIEKQIAQLVIEIQANEQE